MIITNISTRNFGVHKKVDVELPRTGLVLVTGRNGQGKSTLSEAVSQGAWNEPVRGKPGWVQGQKSGVRVDFEGGHVQRAVAKAKHTLTWKVEEDGAAEYPTRTKAQDALNVHIGSFRVWRHACVFHTKKASIFTEATDSDRKRLLEEVLELDRVEKAYRKSLDEVRAAKHAHNEAEHVLALRTAELEGHRKQKEVLAGEVEDVPDLAALRAEARQLKTQKANAKQVLDDIKVRATAARDAWLEAKGTLERMQSRADKLRSLEGTCDHCEQPIDAEACSAHLKGVLDEISSLQAAIAELEASKCVLEAEAQKSQLVLENITNKLSSNVHKGKAAVAAQDRNAARAGKLATIDAEIEKAEIAVRESQEMSAKAARTHATLKLSSEVLSYTGVRASLLDVAVRSLQDLANVWLGRLGLEGLEVRLSSQSENAKGRVSDKISFEVEGAGGGYGYLAASTGEQRRIDIAMLMAMGELAGASRGLSPHSTLFIDEVFDGLDDLGRPAAVAMLKELATERCVVVITHHQDLIASLAPDLHLVAENGSISGKR